MGVVLIASEGRHRFKLRLAVGPRPATAHFDDWLGTKKGKERRLRLRG